MRLPPDPDVRPDLRLRCPRNGAAHALGPVARRFFRRLGSPVGGHNTIAAEGAQAIAAVLPQCKVLSRLSYVGAYPARTRRPSVRAHSSPRRPRRLSVPRFAGNPIGPYGANALAAALPRCPSLVWLAYVVVSDGALDRAAHLTPGRRPPSRSLERTGIDDALKNQIYAEVAKNKAPDRVQLGTPPLRPAATPATSLSGRAVCNRLHRQRPACSRKPRPVGKRSRRLTHPTNRPGREGCMLRARIGREGWVGWMDSSIGGAQRPNNVR